MIRQLERNMLVGLVVAATVIIFLIQKCWSLCKLDYWKNRNVAGPKPVPFFGNISDMVFLKKSIGQVHTEIYRFAIYILENTAHNFSILQRI